MSGPSWTYYLTRDSLDGVLDDFIDLWIVKPIRVSKNGRVAWVEPDHASYHDVHIGRDRSDYYAREFGVYPETDRELIIAEQGQTKRNTRQP